MIIILKETKILTVVKSKKTHSQNLYTIDLFIILVGAHNIHKSKFEQYSKSGFTNIGIIYI